MTITNIIVLNFKVRLAMHVRLGWLIQDLKPQRQDAVSFNVGATSQD